MSEVFHKLDGKAKDIETIIRLRSWMEDEVEGEVGGFSSTSLLTDFDSESEIFEFQLLFYK